MKTKLILILSLITLPLSLSATTSKASYYTKESCQREGTSGVWTASSERYNEEDWTCALPHYNFGGLYKVTNLETGISIVVRHNDYGPGKKPRRRGVVIDLSKAAFRFLSEGNLRRGLLPVKVKVWK